MQVTGTLKLINETKTFGANGFQKRETVLTTNEQYPQDLLIEFIQDNCAKLDYFKVGDEVTIGINLKGREWVNPQGETKYFNTVQGWKIEGVGANNAQAVESPAQKQAGGISEENQDDLSF
jgi:hypothetical protein